MNACAVSTNSQLAYTTSHIYRIQINALNVPLTLIIFDITDISTPFYIMYIQIEFGFFVLKRKGNQMLGEAPTSPALTSRCFFLSSSTIMQLLTLVESLFLIQNMV